MENSAKPDPRSLLNALQQFAAQHAIETWYLAYSGGLDSQVLLHLLAASSLPVSAVYVDHGLQAESLQWAEHCRDSCSRLQVPFQMISVDARPQPGQSPEAAAREARYTALARLIGPQCALLTAQHQDDQAETLLLQLLRGAGAAGLAAMPYSNRFAAGWHLRPLLNWRRQAIAEYAEQQHLNWVEDPSNQSPAYDRNFLRHRVVPVLAERWPSFSVTLARAAELQAEQAELLDELAERDLEQVSSEQGCPQVDTLAEFSHARQANLLRCWIRQSGFSLPSRAVVDQVLQQMLAPREDADPVVSWGGLVMRRYRGELYLLADNPHDPAQTLDWQPRQPLYLPGLRQILQMQASGAEHVGLKSTLAAETLQVRFRQGREKIQPPGRGGHHSLKNLFQEAGVPPWLRDRIPLLFLGDELVAVVGYWIAAEYAAAEGERAVLPVLLKEAGGTTH